MNSLSMNPAFVTSVEALMNMVRYASMLVVPTFVVMQLIVALARGFTAIDGVRVDYSPVARGLILLVSLFFYAEVMGLISGAITDFSRFITQPDNIYENLSLLGGAVTQDPQPKENSLKGYLGQAIEWMSTFNLHYWLQSLVVGGFASVARKIMEILQQTLLGFLFIVGPIALSLSVLPGFEGLLKKWFHHFLSVHCWSISLVLLDHLADLYTHLSQARTSVMSGLSLSEASEKIDILLITLVMALLYLMVPYLTSLYVGQSSSGMFASRVISLTAAGVPVAAKAPLVAGRGAIGLASGVQLAARGISSAASSLRETTPGRVVEAMGTYAAMAHGAMPYAPVSPPVSPPTSGGGAPASTPIPVRQA